MPVDLRIVGWKARGFRCPDHEINLIVDGGEPQTISLIQMPNGTGKTTTLLLLRTTLSGSAKNWKAEEIKRLRKRNSDDSGIFLLELLLNGQRLTLELTMDFGEGVARYRTTFGSGIKNGYHPPAPLVKFLKDDFVHLFVFDGELAARLLDHKHTNAEDAIDSLFQLKFFQHLSTRVLEFWEQSVENRTAKDTRGLTQRKNRLGRLRERLTECEAAYESALDARDSLKRNLKGRKARFSEAIKLHKEYKEKLQDAEDSLANARRDLLHKTTTVLARIRDPHSLSPAFATEMVDLRLNLDRVKLPESAAREFFEELAQETDCVCGRPLDVVSRDAIRKRAARYLGSDEVGLLSAMKSDIATMVGSVPQEHNSDLSSRLKELKEGIRHEAEMQTVRDAIQEDAVANNPELEEAQDQISTLEQQLGAAEQEVGKYEDPSDSAGDDDVFGVKVLKRRIDDAEKKVSEITQTLDLKAKRDSLQRVLDKAHDFASQSICKQTVDDANARMQALMPHNAIRIEKIDRCLVLQGQEGGSMGETLSIAYAFLSTLFNSADHSLPFVVDSPAGPIDLAVRPRIAQLIPKLTNQFIAFTISSERDRFVPELAMSADQKVKYLTLFRKDADGTGMQTPKVSEAILSDDGFLVQGADFFNNFQMESEDEE